MMKFKLGGTITDQEGKRQVIEVRRGKKLIAAIYTHEDSIAIVSKYLKKVETDKAFPPKVTVKFEVGGI